MSAAPFAATTTRWGIAAGSRVVIVGGGIIGCAVAFALTGRGHRDVVVVERGRVGEGATAYATGGIRQQFASRVNVELAHRSVRFWEAFEQRTGHPLDLRQHGYLFLLASTESLAAFTRAAEMQRTVGVDVEVLAPDDIGGVFPGLRTDGLVGATWCPTDGSASPSDAVRGLVAAARAGGARMCEGMAFTGLLRDADGAVRGVDTSRGTLEADLVLLAAGPQAQEVAARCGVDIPVSPHPRQAFAIAAVPGLHGDLPLVVDMDTGAYLHPQVGGTAVIGGTDRDRSEAATATVDWDRLPRLVEALVRIHPALADAAVVRGWAGLREMTPDDHAIVGPVEDVPGLWVAAGFSGHGFMQAPAIGECLAAWWLDGAPPIDLGPLRLSRFGAPSVAAERIAF